MSTIRAAHDLGLAVFDALADEDADLDALRRCANAFLFSAKEPDWPLWKVSNDLAYATLEWLNNQSRESLERLRQSGRAFETARLK
jgi:hypothetical protein